MKTIPLTQGLYAWVDDEDYQRLAKYKWHVSKQGRNWYAVRNIKYRGNWKKKVIKMESMIIKVPKGMIADHINGYGLDNRKTNLRPCNNAQNTRNARMRKGTSSQYKGVSWHKNNKSYQANISYNYKVIYLGSFENEIEAAGAYDKAAIKLHGEFARLNF